MIKICEKITNPIKRKPGKQEKGIARRQKTHVGKM
jgi:hypothetical protein